MNLAIVGLGTAVPKNSMTQTDAVKLAEEISPPPTDQTGLLSTLYRRTRVQTRSSVLLNQEGTPPKQSFFRPPLHQKDFGPTTGERMKRYEKEAPRLAVSAVRRAFIESRLEPSKIGQLITVSCTGFVAPGVDLKLIEEFKLAGTVGRTQIGFMGCHGAFNGLRIASSLAHTDPKQGILLCSVELCSLHFHYGWEPEKIVANALFSDGAGALIGVSANEASRDAWRLAQIGSYIFPDSENAMTWKIRDHGFEMTLSSAIPNLIANHLRPWLEDWLGQAGIPLKGVRSWAIHPGGPRILSEIIQALDLKREDAAASEEVLAQYGNMSSATVFFILERLRLRGAERPCVAIGFGPGLALETAVFL